MTFNLSKPLLCKDQEYVEETWKYLHIVGKLLITT